MNQIIYAFFAGLRVGPVFSLIKLPIPIPAPAITVGIMGIVGLFCGFLLVSHLTS